MVDPCLMIRVTKEDHEEYCKPQLNSLVVYLLGKMIKFKFLEARLQKMQAKGGYIKVIDISEDYYMNTFMHESNYKYAFQEGPQVIVEHYLFSVKMEIGLPSRLRYSKENGSVVQSGRASN